MVFSMCMIPGSKEQPGGTNHNLLVQQMSTALCDSSTSTNCKIVHRVSAVCTPTTLRTLGLTNISYSSQPQLR